MCHAVFQSGLRGIIPLRNLLAPSWPAGTAICCCETLDHSQPISHWASTGLLNYNISNFFCKRLNEGNSSLGTNVQVLGDHCLRLRQAAYSCSWSNLLCWGPTVFTKEGSWSHPACLTWLHPCNSRGEKLEWKGSSVTNILFLTHNLLQNHTSLCCSHTMQCMRVSVHIHMSLCVACLSMSKNRCVSLYLLKSPSWEYKILVFIL